MANYFWQEKIYCIAKHREDNLERCCKIMVASCDGTAQTLGTQRRSQHDSELAHSLEELTLAWPRQSYQMVMQGLMQ